MKKKIIWIIYIVIIIFAVFYFTKISPRNEKEDINAEAPFGLYKDMISMIRRDNYFFDFDIISKDIKIKYTGKKDKTKEDSKIFYDDKVGEVVDLEKYIDLDFINPNYLFDILEENEYELDNKDEIRIFVYNIFKDFFSVFFISMLKTNYFNIWICFVYFFFK